MNYEQVTRLTSEAMILCLMVSAPAVIVSAVVGLLVSFFQAVTSMQDQAISQGVKMVAVVITVVVAAPWGAFAVLQFAQALLRVAFA
jgi:type III secretion protein S